MITIPLLLVVVAIILLFTWNVGAGLLVLLIALVWAALVEGRFR